MCKNIIFVYNMCGTVSIQEFNSEAFIYLSISIIDCQDKKADNSG